MRAVVVAVGLMLAAGQAGARNTTGNELHDACEGQETGFCVGFILGTIEGIRLGIGYPLMVSGSSDAEAINNMSNTLLGYCDPDGALNGQYVDIARNYLRNHPETRQHPARSLVLLSLQEAFPCRE